MATFAALPGVTMKVEKHIDIREFDYDLPPGAIAQFPLEQRDASKLVICRKNVIEEDVFLRMDEHLPEGSLVIFNNTRVIRARLIFTKNTGATIEIFCLEPVLPFSEVQSAFLEKETCTWNCLIGNVKRWKDGSLHKKFHHHNILYELTATLKGNHGEGCFLVEFRWTPSQTRFSEILEMAGKVPLPPYIERAPGDSDLVRYQTIYAEHEGSVAAPTAGLHFSEEVIRRLRKKNMDLQQVTLHVGLGTFRPVSAADIADHVMHEERIIVHHSVIEKLLQHHKKPLVAVGTTSVRTLESLYWAGVKLLTDKSPVSEIGQWDPYEEKYEVNIPVSNALEAVLTEMRRTKQDEYQLATRLMIIPGYRFRLVDILITNFHQPQSTLLLLVAAFVGNNWKAVYEYAIRNQFRFLSYGDACLFFRHEGD